LSRVRLNQRKAELHTDKADQTIFFQNGVRESHLLRAIVVNRNLISGSHSVVFPQSGLSSYHSGCYWIRTRLAPLAREGQDAQRPQKQPLRPHERQPMISRGSVICPVNAEAATV